jgi:hypothetical protein
MRRAIKWTAAMGVATVAMSMISAAPAAADRHFDGHRDHFRRVEPVYVRPDCRVRTYWDPVLRVYRPCLPAGPVLDVNIRL